MTRSAIAIADPRAIPRLKNSPSPVLNIKVTPASSDVTRTNLASGRRITVVFSLIRILLVSLVGTLSIGEARGLRQWLVAGLTRHVPEGHSLGRFLPKLAGCGSSAAGLSGGA